MAQGRPFTLGETDPQTRASLALLQHAAEPRSAPAGCVLPPQMPP
jgi:hypothetical protein